MMKVALASELTEMFSLFVIVFFLFPSCQYEEGKKRRKPNYSSVDLSEVEWEDRDDVVSDLFSSLVRRELHCTLLCTWRLPGSQPRVPPEGHLATRGSRRPRALVPVWSFVMLPPVGPLANGPATLPSLCSLLKPSLSRL